MVGLAARAPKVGLPPDIGRSVVGTLSGPPNRPLPALARDLGCVEIRADLIGEVDPERLRRQFRGPLLYTLRSAQEGGRCTDTTEQRRRRLRAAAERYDLVDLEGARDLHPALLDRISPDRRVISWHGPPADPTELTHRYSLLRATAAATYRLGPAAATLGEALAPLRFLNALDGAGRGTVSAYASGPVGTWTRVLSLRYGAPFAFGWLDHPGAAGPDHVPPEADGAPPVQRLLADFTLPGLTRARRIYGVVSTSSFAPFVSNTAYRLLGLPAVYVRFTTDDLTGSVDDLCAGLDELGLPLGGLCIAPPHKEAALALAAEATPLARRSGEAVVLLRRGQEWWADSIAEGVLRVLARHRVPLAGQQAAVVGCGGTGRAVIAGLQSAGADVTLVNRSAEAGARAADRFGVPFVPLEEFTADRHRLVVHATPVADRLPFTLDGIRPDAAILDLTYRTAPTRLIAAARSAGLQAISGHQMMLTEAGRQFELMTGHPFPADQIEAALAGQTATHNPRNSRSTSRKDRR